jgi:hypothetical protein
MNIKTVSSSPIVPLEPKQKAEGNSRTVGTADRDADGRGSQREQELKRHLKPEELEEALKILSESPGLKSNQLTVRVEQKEDCRVIYIEDPGGNIVRRLSESQLWAATRDKDRTVGKILDKAM